MRLEWAGHPIDVREAGAGPCIVLVHGYPLDGAMWSGVARSLATRFRVLKPDLPGRGENPAPAPRDMEGYADFLQALLGALPPPVGLAGFSMGGYVSLALLRREPAAVRALALVDTRAEADDEEDKKKRDEAIAAARSAGATRIAEAMVPKLLSEASLSNRDLVERLRRIILRQKPETLEADLTAMRGRRDSSDLLSQIRIPTLVLVGEYDALAPPALAEKMAAAIAGARRLLLGRARRLTA
jgi:pimeloyl-ACP methyl ester carboxylesterase